MTNILLLSVLIFQTNVFQAGARTPFGGWASWYSWNAEISYFAPAGVYVVESIPEIEGPIPMVYTNEQGIIRTNGWNNECWQEMNTATTVINGFYQGFYTNLFAGTNTIRLPIRPFSHQFFRMKKKE